jgi:hypothetical protein
MLEWINEDFFWVPNKSCIYNINNIDRFFIKEDDRYTSYYDNEPKRYYYICIDFANCTCQANILEFTARQKAVDEMLNFLKSRPKSSKENNKILID